MKHCLEELEAKNHHLQAYITGADAHRRMPPCDRMGQGLHHFLVALIRFIPCPLLFFRSTFPDGGLPRVGFLGELQWLDSARGWNHRGRQAMFGYIPEELQDTLDER